MKDDVRGFKSHGDGTLVAMHVVKMESPFRDETPRAGFLKMY